jgi:hypothetical protein
MVSIGAVFQHGWSQMFTGLAGFKQYTTATYDTSEIQEAGKVNSGQGQGQGQGQGKGKGQGTGSSGSGSGDHSFIV